MKPKHHKRLERIEGRLDIVQVVLNEFGPRKGAGFIDRVRSVAAVPLVQSQTLCGVVERAMLATGLRQSDPGTTTTIIRAQEKAVFLAHLLTSRNSDTLAADERQMIATVAIRNWLATGLLMVAGAPYGEEFVDEELFREWVVQQRPLLLAALVDAKAERAITETIEGKYFRGQSILHKDAAAVQRLREHYAMRLQDAFEKVLRRAIEVGYQVAGLGIEDETVAELARGRAERRLRDVVDMAKSAMLDHFGRSSEAMRISARLLRVQEG